MFFYANVISLTSPNEVVIDQKKKKITCDRDTYFYIPAKHP